MHCLRMSIFSNALEDLRFQRCRYTKYNREKLKIIEWKYQLFLCSLCLLLSIRLTCWIWVILMHQVFEYYNVSYRCTQYVFFFLSYFYITIEKRCKEIEKMDIDFSGQGCKQQFRLVRHKHVVVLFKTIQTATSAWTSQFENAVWFHVFFQLSLPWVINLNLHTSASDIYCSLWPNNFLVSQ